MTLFSSTLQLKWSEGKTIKCKKDFWAATETRRRKTFFRSFPLGVFSLTTHLFSAVFCQASSERASLPLLLPSRCFIPVSSPPRPGKQNNTKNRPPLPFPDLPPTFADIYPASPRPTSLHRRKRARRASQATNHRISTLTSLLFLHTALSGEKKKKISFLFRC